MSSPTIERSATPTTPTPADAANLPTGLRLAEARPSEAQMAAEPVLGGTEHLAIDVIETAPTVVGTAAAVAVGAGAVVIEWGRMMWDVFHAEQDGTLHEVLNDALGGAASRETSPEGQLRGLEYGAGMAVVLAGVPDSQIAAMHRPDVGSSFDEGIAAARRLQQEDPATFRQACDEYRHVTREYQQGRAAALQGWHTADRGAAFDAGYTRTLDQLRVADPATLSAQRQAVAARQQGFLDAARGHVDQNRKQNDVTYAVGVAHHARVLAERGPSGVAQDVARIQRETGVQRPPSRG